MNPTSLASMFVPMFLWLKKNLYLNQKCFKKHRQHPIALYRVVFAHFNKLIDKDPMPRYLCGRYEATMCITLCEAVKYRVQIISRTRFNWQVRAHTCLNCGLPSSACSCVPLCVHVCPCACAFPLHRERCKTMTETGSTRMAKTKKKW